MQLWLKLHLQERRMYEASEGRLRRLENRGGGGSSLALMPGDPGGDDEEEVGGTGGGFRPPSYTDIHLDPGATTATNTSATTSATVSASTVGMGAWYQRYQRDFQEGVLARNEAMETRWLGWRTKFVSKHLAAAGGRIHAAVRTLLTTGDHNSPALPSLLPSPLCPNPAHHR